jgi:hypothetical protein
VIEVANARDVVDRAGLVRLFERIGFHLDGSHDLYETLEAQIMERRVRWQLSDNRQPRGLFASGRVRVSLSGGRRRPGTSNCRRPPRACSP